MAEIYPFRALHYNLRKVDPAKTVTQPYDKISPEMQAHYYDLSPYNLVRIIRRRPDDPSADNAYTRAGRDFRQWIEHDVLTSESEAALYAYNQEYLLPGQAGAKRVRRGFIALCRLEDYARGVVHRHEETLSGPKADRLELLKVTRAHFGQIFMLYSDPAEAVEKALALQVTDRPWQSVRDEYGTAHSVWRVADPQAIQKVVTAMRDKKLVIADGHHRYETALAYRNLCRAGSVPDDRPEYVMTTFIRKESEGLTILPTHRVVHGLVRFDWRELATRATRFFDWEELATSSSDWHAKFSAMLAAAGRERPSLGAYGGPGKVALLKLRRDADLASALSDLPTGLRRLDVVLLHRLVLETGLGIDRQAVREEQNLRYVRELDIAIREVDSGKAQTAFLMNATPIEAVWSNALAGRALPQKSTDFYPKLLSGLTIYWLDNPAGM